MFRPEPVEIVGYEDGVPVVRITRHGGGTFVELHSNEKLYGRAVYRGGGARGSREEEAEVISALDPVYAEGYRLTVAHRVTAVIDVSLDELREAIAKVDDERVPIVEDSTLDTRPEPTLWCDAWKSLWHAAMWDAPLVFSERREAHVSPQVGEALKRVDMDDILRPGDRATVSLILPTDIDFSLAFQLRRQSVHKQGKQATHLPVCVEGLPKDRFISGMLELRQRIIQGDREAEDLLMSAYGDMDDPTLLLEAEESEMLGALLAICVADSGCGRALSRLKAMGHPWSVYAGTLD